MVALITVPLLFLLAWLGADWATRFRYVVIAVSVLALLSFFIGGIPHMNMGHIVRQMEATALEAPRVTWRVKLYDKYR